MKLFESKHLIALLGVLALVVSGCASGGTKPTKQQFEAPETVAEEPDKKLFSQALKAQNGGQFESAIKLWKSFLSKYPKSFEGHNNLGLVYYTQDMLSQALGEFETAYRLQQDDPKIRKNLARALRFKASMLHENRQYFETLEILARLELIVEPEEKQGILFKQEQVEDQIYLQVIKADSAASYQEFIQRFPDGLNAVRAREYLEKNPNKVSSKVSKNTAKPITSNAKSWISSGKADAWASAEQPPDYSSSSRPSAVYTPPPGGGSKKTGDFFGADPEGMKKAEEASAKVESAVDPAAAIPFEDFEKPERSSGDPAAVVEESVDVKESNRVAGEFNPNRDEPDTVTAGLDTFPDLKPVPVTELPEEIDTSKPEETAAGAIEMQPVEQEAETEETASVEEPVEQAEEVAEQATNEEAIPAEPEAAQVENAAPESVESESERIARIVKEEIEKAENGQSEQAQPEAAEEAAVESPQETPLEVASIDPAENAEVEAAPVEETPANPDAEKTGISQETVSETVAAMMPTPPSPEVATQAPAESMDSSNSMVLVQMRAGATLNVRAEPTTQGEILGYLENGDMMPFMSESGDWYQIEIEEGQSGWISKKYSTLQNETTEVASAPAPSEPAPESAPAPSEPAPGEELSSELTPLGTKPQQPSGSMIVVTVGEGATLNVRALPSASGAVVDMLFRGDKLPLVKEEGEWYQVEFEDETTGWISKKFSIIEGSTLKASLPAPQGKNEEAKAPTSQSNGMVTTVVVIKVPKGSSLNVRSSPSSQGQVMGSLKSGDMRPLLEEADEWYQVELQDGQSGWISRKFSGKMDVDSSFLNSP
jgi:uncharacterized protein YgiM (DUF1202 family)/Tfp pilus assembly protein PilF